MTAHLKLSLASEPFERVPADVALAGFFPGERPLRGAAGRVDWRLCGLASDLLADGRMRERAGDALLVPAAGRLAASRVMLFGLGRRSSLSAARIQKITASAIRRGLALGARRLALSPPGEDGISRHAGPVLAGAAEAVVGGDVEVELCLVIDPSEVASARRALERALAADPLPAVELLAPSGSPRGASSRPEARVRTPSGAPATGRSPSPGAR